MPPVDRIVVDRAPWATRVAFLAAGEVVELWIEGADRPSLLGGVALARVTATIPRLGAAIVAIPDGEALLSDHPAVEGGRLLVQIARDASGGKRAVARAAVELADGAVVLTPAQARHRPGGGDRRQARRAALRSALAALIPQDIGLVVRSAAADLPQDSVIATADGLLRRWHDLEAKARSLEPPAWVAPPAPLLEAARALAPGVEPEVDDSGRLFEACGAGDALEAALARRVPLAGGGELVVDAAEAASLIDVNLPSGGGREGFRRANEAAGLEALRQMRLRGLRGTVLLDLPRMTDRAARARLLERIREAAAQDPTPVRVLGWTPAACWNSCARVRAARWPTACWRGGTPRA